MYFRHLYTDDPSSFIDEIESTSSNTDAILQPQQPIFTQKKYFQCNQWNGVTWIKTNVGARLTRWNTNIKNANPEMHPCYVGVM